MTCLAPSRFDRTTLRRRAAGLAVVAGALALLAACGEAPPASSYPVLGSDFPSAAADAPCPPARPPDAFESERRGRAGRLP
jgi:hypothetical protein